MSEMSSRGLHEKVVCALCPHHCVLSEGQRGICHARIARGGEVVCENYGCVTGMALDPIEKKPLARFFPGSQVFSIGSFGCNLRCPFCQNAGIATAGIDNVSWHPMTPEAVVEQGKALRDQGNIGIAYTYNEPLVGYEFVLDCARLAREAGLKNILVTNGMICPEPLDRLLPFIDAINIDLKGNTQGFYDMVGGNIDAVKQTVASCAACETCHVEVTTLVIPQENDDLDEIEAIAAWLADMDSDISYHLSRFFPCHHRADREPTSVAVVYDAIARARKHLRYVYPGNC
ncbi:MAG: AmmeMemoRadiSam system radical SAM enzyme [Raoultibacter sp.]